MYPAKEDSFLLSRALENYLKNLKDKNIKFLDLGTGSAIQAKTTLKYVPRKNILCSDINNKAIKNAKKFGFKSINSDLFFKIKQKFDLISFNAPYLPEDKYDKKKDTSGGKRGDEIILKFLKQAKSHLIKNGKIFLLLSSLTPKKRILLEIKKLHLKKRKVAEKNIFFEILEVWVISS